MKQQNWKKIGLHSHTLWSDGKGVPEQMVSAYKVQGFDAVVWTDHNFYADGQETVWLPVMPDEGPWPGSLSVELYEDYKARFPVDEKKIAVRTFVRLKNYAEIRAQMEEPGRFLILPGNELTSLIDVTAKEREMHLNCIHFPCNMSFLPGKTPEESLEWNRRRFAEKNNDSGYMQLNHPLWRFYNVDPMILVRNTAIRHFEICNGGSPFTVLPGAYTSDSFFDIVNAFRLKQGQNPVFASAADDSHLYLPYQWGRGAGVGNAFVMADTEEFSHEGVVRALEAGKYYSSAGVLLDRIETGSRTLRVEVRPEPGVHYRIEFIGTPADFDASVEYRDIPATETTPARRIPFFSPTIGQTLKVVEGTIGECTMPENWLYLRAKITSDQPTTIRTPYFPDRQCAWTQIMQG